MTKTRAELEKERREIMEDRQSGFDAEHDELLEKLRDAKIDPHELLSWIGKSLKYGIGGSGA